jgi:hypothetical protein
MKYVISWRERPAASFADYEAPQERVLRIFNKDWKMPASFTVHQFVIRVGDYGGYMIVETSHKGRAEVRCVAAISAPSRATGAAGR